MKKSKTCVFKIPNILKLRLLINIKQMAILSVAISTLFGMESVRADTPTQKAEKIICETVQTCQELSGLIQTQIKQLEDKGLENLTGKERLQYIKLKKQVIATENQTQEFQKETITSENQKQIEQRKEIESKLKAQDSKLDELRGALLLK